MISSTSSCVLPSGPGWLQTTKAMLSGAVCVARMKRTRFRSIWLMYLADTSTLLPLKGLNWCWRSQSSSEIGSIMRPCASQSPTAPIAR
jgi:hypothetical protein